MNFGPGLNIVSASHAPSTIVFLISLFIRKVIKFLFQFLIADTPIIRIIRFLGIITFLGFSDTDYRPQDFYYL